MTADCIDLYELQQQLRDGLEELFPGRIWVRAEIASIPAKIPTCSWVIPLIFRNFCKTDDSFIIIFFANTPKV